MGQILSDEEIQSVLMSFARVRGEKGFEEDEAVAVIHWAEEAKLGGALLENVLNGVADVDVDDKGEAIFSITNKGREEVEEASDIRLHSQSELLQ